MIIEVSTFLLHRQILSQSGSVRLLAGFLGRLNRANFFKLLLVTCAFMFLIALLQQIDTIFRRKLVVVLINILILHKPIINSCLLQRKEIRANNMLASRVVFIHFTASLELVLNF
ncbi:hypothetical protein ACJX0J_013237, partial [Zea mays]